MAITFKYKRIERPKPFPPIHTPSIPVTLRGEKESLDVVAIIDSGADTTAIPRGVAEILGLDLSGEKEEVVGIGGRIPAVKTTVGITVTGVHEKYNFLLHTFVVLEETEDNFPILLGRQDFFENFDIMFKENERKIILKKVER